MSEVSDGDAVELSVRKHLDDPSSWTEPTGYPDSLALCAIDSVYSLQSRYSAAVRVVDRYRTYRRDQGGRPDRDGASELLAAIQESGGPVPGTTLRQHAAPKSITVRNGRLI